MGGRLEINEGGNIPKGNISLDEFCIYLTGCIAQFKEYYQNGIVNGFEGNPDSKFDAVLHVADWMEIFNVWDDMNHG